MTASRLTDAQLDEVRDRFDALQGHDAVQDLLEDRSHEVVRHQWSEQADESHRPEPYWQQTLGRAPRRRADVPINGGQRLGLDSDGRVVLAQGWADGTTSAGFDAISWRPDRVEFAAMRPEGAIGLRTLWFDGARPVHQIACEAGIRRPDGRGAVEVTVYDVDADGRVHRAITVHESGSDPSWDPERGPSWVATCTAFTYAGNELALVEHLVADGPLAWNEDFHGALRTARQELERPSRRSVIWDGRLLAPVGDLPEPDLAFEGLAQPLADAVLSALHHVRDQIGELAFLAVNVEASSFPDRPYLLSGVAAGAAFVERVGPRGLGIGEVIGLAATGASDAAPLDVVGAASAETQTRVRAGLQALSGDWQRCAAGSERLAREMAERLQRLDWGPRTPYFLPLVSGRDPGFGRDGFGPSRQVLGDSRVDAVLAAVGATRRSESDYCVLEEQPPPTDPPATRGELAEQLAGAGLQEAAAQAVADDAQWAIVLAGGGTGVSRVGGAPEVPVGTAWPRHGGRALVHLATIAFAELPEVEGRDLFPSDGTLAIFADIADDSEFWEPVGPGDPDRSQIALVETRPGSEVVALTPPADAHVLPERCVRPTPRLQLQEAGFGSATSRYGVDAIDEQAIDDLRWRLIGHPHRAQLLGFPPVAQDDPRDEGDIALFHIDSDEFDIGFLDGGDLLFFLSPQDLAARRWDRVTAWPSSC
jgi:hypothetical protein